MFISASFEPLLYLILTHTTYFTTKTSLRHPQTLLLTLISLLEVNEIKIEVQPDVEHEWLLSTKDVAEGYGVKVNAINMTKTRNPEEFLEGKHYMLFTTDGGRPYAMWTKRGVARLGFFIKTPMAKEFRDWAEDYIVNETHSSKVGSQIS